MFAFLLAISVGVAAALKWPCDVDSCPGGENACVKVGQYCFTQSRYYQPLNSDGLETSFIYDGSNANLRTPTWDPESPCGFEDVNPNTYLPSKCPVCSEDDTICHQGRCLKLTQTDQPTENSCCIHPTLCGKEVYHKYCKAGYYCSTDEVANNGVIGEGLCKPIQYSREIGEACEPDVTICAGDSTCDTVSKLCVSNKVAPFECDSNADCEFGKYCQHTYAFTGLAVSRACATSLFENGVALGASCDATEIGNWDYAGQCGHGLLCSRDSPTSAKCIEPFTKSKDQPCSSEYDCKAGTFCRAGVCADIHEDTNGLFVNDCCSAGKEISCPHVSYAAEASEQRCYLTEERQTSVILSKKWTASDKKLSAKLQSSRCQVRKKNYKCADAVLRSDNQPPSDQVKCSSTYQGFHDYSGSSTIAPVSMVVVSLFVAVSLILQ